MYCGMDEKVRIGFLSAMLKLKLEEIRETRLLIISLRKQRKKGKIGISDMKKLMNNNIGIDIEIQLAAMNIWAGDQPGSRKAYGI